MKTKFFYVRRALALVALTLALACLLSGCAISMNAKVVTVDGREVRMQEYCYYYNYYKDQINSSDSYWESGNHSAEEEQIRQAAMLAVKRVAAIEHLLDENGVVLTDGDRAHIQNLWDTYAENSGGEEKWIASLNAQCLTKELYLKNLEYTQRLSRYIYERFNEEITSKYLRAKHILLKFTSDGGSYSAPDAKAKAQELCKELKNGADFDELVKKYGEDPGMEQNPNGYYFTFGKMVKSFEDATLALDYGEVSEPVRSDYGYHVILRLELDDQEMINQLETLELTDYFNAVYAETTEWLNSVDIKYNYLVYLRIKPSTVVFKDK